MMNANLMGRRFSSLFCAAALTGLGTTLILPSVASAAPIVEVQLHAQTGHSLAETGPIITTAPTGADQILVTILPPENGDLTVTYDPSELWQEDTGGSWSALLPVSAGLTKQWFILVEVAGSSTTSIIEESFITLATTAAQTPLNLTIAVGPQAGAITEMVDDLLSMYCPGYLSAHQNPSEAPSASLWGMCCEHEGVC